MTDTFGFTPTEKMLTPSTLAAMLEISERHLTDLRREHASFPTPVMLGTLPRWSPAAIRRWMDPSANDSCACNDQPPAAVDLPAKPRKAKGARRVH